MFWLGILVGFLIGGTFGFLLCGLLTSGRIADLEAELRKLRKGGNDDRP